MSVELWVLEHLLEDQINDDELIRSYLGVLPYTVPTGLPLALQARFMLRDLKRINDVSERTLDALSILAMISLKGPENFAPFTRVSELSPGLELCLQVKTELVLRPLRKGDAANFHTLLSKYFPANGPKRLCKQEKARHAELLRARDDPSEARHLTAKHIRGALQDSLEAFVKQASDALGPSFLKEVENDVACGKYVYKNPEAAEAAEAAEEAAAVVVGRSETAAEAAAGPTAEAAAEAAMAALLAEEEQEAAKKAAKKKKNKKKKEKEKNAKIQAQVQPSSQQAADPSADEKGFGGGVSLPTGSELESPVEGGSEPLSVAMAGPPLVGEGVEVFLVGVDGGSDEPPLAADAGTPSVGEGEEGVLVGVEGDSEPPETVREVAAASERVQAAAAAEGPSADHGSWKDHLSGSDHSSGTDHLARNDAVHAEPAFLGGAAGDPAGSSRSPGGRAAAALDRMGEDLVCSVTQDLFVDPVIAADGFTYERSAIEDWLSRKGTSPMTNLPLPHSMLIPNLAVRKAVENLQAIKEAMTA